MRFLGVVISVLFMHVVLAQDPIYTQYNSSDIYLNPAHAGTVNGMSTNLQARYQWPLISGGGYQTYLLGFQSQLSKIKSGIGLIFTQDIASDFLYTTSLSASFSKHFTIKRKLQIGIGIQAGFEQKSIDASKLIFADQINPQSGSNTSSNNTTTLNSAVIYPNIAGGFVLKAFNVTLGASSHNILEPNQSLFSNSTSKLPRRYTTYLNYDHAINETGKVFVSPNIILVSQADFRYLQVGATGQYYNFKLGLGYRNSQDLIYCLGYTSDRFAVSYSFDHSFGKIDVSYTGGTHELALVFRFGGKNDYSGKLMNAF